MDPYYYLMQLSGNDKSY